MENDTTYAQEGSSMPVGSELGSVEFYNRDDLAEQTPWLAPNGRSLFMARWVVEKYDGTHYMDWNKSVQEWVRQSKIILEISDGTSDPARDF